MITRQAIGAVDGSSGAIRVLFDCPAARPLLCPAAEGGIGGAELRAVTFARELARRPGFDVGLLVAAGRDSPEFATVDGLTIHWELGRTRASGVLGTARARLQHSSDRLAGSLLKRVAGIPERRRAVERLEYDVLCCFGVTNRTASLVRSARHTGRRVIVFLTSDRSLEDIQRRGRRDRGVYGELGCLCRFALHTADAVVVQTRHQQLELQARMRIDGHLIRNPIDLQACPEFMSAPGTTTGDYALWVGRADTFSKRADVCWDLARGVPELTFVAVMNAHEPSTFDRLLATQPANVRLIRFVPADQIEPYYRRATLLINTSDAEGFPNSFLQAGKYGVPIVSLNVDPDGMLGEHGGGVCCKGSRQRMQSELRRLTARGTDYHRMADCVQRYTRQYHALHQRADDLELLIRETAGSRAAA